MATRHRPENGDQNGEPGARGEGRASRITNDIKQVTGREPRRLADYVRETAATGVWDVEAEEVTT